MTARSTISRRAQRGAMLLEALIAILIFSIGILGIVGLQATAVQQSTDARYRSEAAQLADQLLGEMWATNRLATDLQNSFNTCASAASCPGYVAFATRVAETLPGVVVNGLNKPTVNVDNAGIVTITVSWKAPTEDTSHQYSFQSQIGQ